MSVQPNARLIQRGRGTRPDEAPATTASTKHGRCQLRPGDSPGKDERNLMTSIVDAPTASPADSLRCRNCGARFPLGPQHACLDCFGPLEVGYDPDLLARVTRDDIAAG